MRISFLKISLIVLAGCCLAAYAGAQTHPYLIFTPQRIAQVKERVKTDKEMAARWDAIKGDVDRALAAGRDANMEALSLAWRMTGEKKYAGAAKQVLIKKISQKQWDGMDDRTPRWNSGLGTARGCFSTALTFDCIYSELSKAERKQIADGIIQLGIKPLLNDWLSDDKRIHALNSMGHNWWSACAFMAGVASLAVMNEEPEAKEWAHNVMQASREWFAFAGSVLENKPANFDTAGGFYESIGYANFGMSEYLLFRLAYTGTFGAVKMPYDDMLEKTADWFINGCYPNSGRLMSLNFGDSNPYADGSKPIAFMLALGYHKDRYYWYLDQVKAGGVEHHHDVSAAVSFVFEPDYKRSPAAPDLPPSAVYKDMGWAMLRSSWARDATLMGVKCGYTWNHAHADAGSFILYHKGKNLLIDAGNVGYGKPEYSSYFVRSEAHNVMLFDGQAQDPQDQYHAVKNPGRLHHLLDGGDLKYVLADATGPTSRFFLRNYRNILWVGDVILVIDDVKTYEPGKFEWLLHFGGEAKKKGPDLEITNEEASVLVRPLFPETLPTGYPHDFPEKMKLEERTGMKDHDVNTKLPYYAISPAEPLRQTKFITAVLLLGEENKAVETFTGSSGASGAAGRSNLPQIEKLEGKDMIGVRITHRLAGEVTYVYFNLLADGRLMHRNSNNIIDGWHTDAYIMALTFPEKSDHSKPENISRFFVSNGSYLRRDGKTLLHSLSKVFMYMKREGSSADVLLQGQPVIQAGLYMKDKPGQVTLNGKKVQPVYKGDKKMLVLDVEN